MVARKRLAAIDFVKEIRFRIIIYSKGGKKMSQITVYLTRVCRGPTGGGLK